MTTIIYLLRLCSLSRVRRYGSFLLHGASAVKMAASLTYPVSAGGQLGITFSLAAWASSWHGDCVPRRSLSRRQDSTC